MSIRYTVPEARLHAGEVFRLKGLWLVLLRVVLILASVMAAIGGALIVSVLLLMKLPYGHSFTPATVAVISLAFGGWAYVAMALASRRSVSPS